MSTKATVYCPADRAHLCPDCDRDHHQLSAVFAKHKRVPVEHSPMQFGHCPYHPDERVECVCFECFDFVCSRCILIGSHAMKEFKDHRLVSNVDSFKTAMMRTSPADLDTKGNQTRLQSSLEEKHQELTDVYVNFERLQDKLNRILESCCSSIDSIQKRRVGYIQSLRRQLLSQLLSIEWFESHLAHARFSLPPGEFLRTLDRHILLIRSLFERAFVDVRDIPVNMLEHIGVEGNLNVTLAKLGQRFEPGSNIFESKWTDLDAEYGRPRLGNHDLVLNAPIGNGLPTRDTYLVPTSFKQVPPEPTNIRTRPDLIGPIVEGSKVYGEIRYPKDAQVPPHLQKLDAIINQNMVSVEEEEAAWEVRDQVPEVIIILRELSGGSKKWSNALNYIVECPVEDRTELVQAMMSLCIVSANGSDQELIRAAIEEEVSKAGGFAGLMFSSRSVLSVLINGILGLVQTELYYLEPMIVTLLKAEGDVNKPDKLFKELERFLIDVTRTVNKTPVFACVIFHSLQEEATRVEFSRDAVLSLITSCMLTRIIAPQLVRIAQNKFLKIASQTLPNFVSWHARWLQRIANHGTVQDKKTSVDALPEEKFASAMFGRMCQFAHVLLQAEGPNSRESLGAVIGKKVSILERHFYNLLERHWNCPTAREMLAFITRTQVEDLKASRTKSSLEETSSEDQ